MKLTVTDKTVSGKNLCTMKIVNKTVEITEKEILIACKNLKINKASAYNMIKNEMNSCSFRKEHYCQSVYWAFISRLLSSFLDWWHYCADEIRIQINIVVLL